ncbi:MAG TPA: GNAT family N-acetyltransferase [Pseudonocardiaceae bacterium]
MANSHLVHGHGGDSRSEWDMLDRVERPCAYACATIGSDVVAVGRAVADTGWAGVFGMATLPEVRGKGAARKVLAALAAWAGEHEAGRMYLQESVTTSRLSGCTSGRVSVNTVTATRPEALLAALFKLSFTQSVEGVEAQLNADRARHPRLSCEWRQRRSW